MQRTSEPDDVDVTVERGIIYAHRETGPLALDLFRPNGPGPAPVVLWLHGGGWFTGDRALAPDLVRHFASRGLAMASIDYRLSGTAIFPAPLHDVRSAIRFLRANGRELGIDPEAIGLWGASAGGHLAALAGLTGHLAQLESEPLDDEPQAEDGEVISAAVRAVAESYAPVDLIAIVDEAQEQLPGRDPSSSPEAGLLGGPPSQRLELARQANPLSWVTGQAPPFQISHGTADSLVSWKQAVRLHDALASAGVPSELHLLDGVRHGFLNPAGLLDVEVARIMDDGLLEAEGPLPSVRRSTSAPEDEDARFGFDTIGDFLSEHLLDRHDTPLHERTTP